MRQWLGLSPLVASVHLVGYVVLVGAAGVVALRLLGLSRHLAGRGLACYLFPWARASLLLVLPFGLLMVMAHATERVAQPALRVTWACIAAAGLHAGLVHHRVVRSVDRWEKEAVAPAAVPIPARVSLTLWSSVMACGRLLA